jgi:hypothetical protein
VSTPQQEADELLAEHQAARMKLAVTRSEQLYNFYAAERRAGADALTANERMQEFAKRLDAPIQQQAAE